MPEGHSIHRVAHALTEIFSNQTVFASSPQGRFTSGARLLNQMVAGDAQAWGKHLFLPFRGSAVASATEQPDLASLSSAGPYQHWLHVHLGLYGSWRFDTDQSQILPHSIGAPRVRIGEGDDKVSGSPVAGSADWKVPEPRGQVRLRLLTEHAVADLSGPTTCEVLNPSQVADIVDRLGPDPIRNLPGDQERFVQLVKRRSISIGQAVMEQSICAGPGNIYRAECLFRTGINPNRSVKQVSKKRLENLWDDLVAGLEDGVRDGKIITVPPALVPKNPHPEDDEAQRFAVYHRNERPCLRCGTQIRVKDMAGRKLYWCPGCQN